jgi:hypothetical protein
MEVGCFNLKGRPNIVPPSLSTAETISLLKEIDPRILKDFIKTVSNNYCIKNGRVMSITFKNGIKHEFIYKEN